MEARWDAGKTSRSGERRFRLASYQRSHVVGLSRKSFEHALELAQARVQELILDSCQFRLKPKGLPPEPNYRADVIGRERKAAVGAIYYRVLMRVELLAPVRARPPV